MGREIRKVPKNWQHPNNGGGDFQPLYDKYYGDAIAKWIKEHNLWLKGKHPDQLQSDPPKYKFFAEWNGNAPDIEYYRTENWSDKEANCFQFYETVTEGTPLSPVFDTLKKLEDWLVTNEGHSRQSAENFCKDGWAPSFTILNGIMKKGVDTCE